MPLTLERTDIACVLAEAYVVPANSALQITGGVAGAVARMAGAAELQAACDALGGCPVGSAVTTPGFRTGAKVIIHAVGPVWDVDSPWHREELASAYRSALTAAVEAGAQSVALPLLSAGSFGCPAEISYLIARRAAEACLEEHDIRITLVLYSKDAVLAAAADMDGLADFLGEMPGHEMFDERTGALLCADAASMPAPAPSYAPEFEPELESEFMAVPMAPQPMPRAAREDCARREEQPERPAQRSRERLGGLFRRRREETAGGVGGGRGAQVLEEADFAPQEFAAQEFAAQEAVAFAKLEPQAQPESPQTLEQLLDSLDEPFSTTLFAIIDSRGLKDSDVYKRANMSRQHFSKIRSDADYRPTKRTVLALAVALQLTVPETRDLLARAGFALSGSSKMDLIVQYYLQRGVYDILTINEALYAYDQQLLV